VFPYLWAVTVATPLVNAFLLVSALLFGIGAVATLFTRPKDVTRFLKPQGQEDSEGYEADSDDSSAATMRA